jgi:hypothetical protein
MAQFNHPEFGGMSQWSPGMTMVGDMFNNGLKSKLDAVCSELAQYAVETSARGRLAIARPLRSVSERHRRALVGGRGSWSAFVSGCSKRPEIRSVSGKAGN